MFSPSPTPFPLKQNLSESTLKSEKICLNWIDIPQVILFGSGLISFFWYILLYLCNQVTFITYNTNLSSLKKSLNPTFPNLWLYFFILLQGLLLSEYPEGFCIQFLLLFSQGVPFFNIRPTISKHLARGCFHTSCMLIFTDSISPATLILSIFVFQIWCHALSRNVPRWLPFLLILLANDIELNPGPPLQNQFLSFMNWNLNSLVKDNFGRVGLIEAHCTNFISANHPENV